MTHARQATPETPRRRPVFPAVGLALLLAGCMTEAGDSAGMPAAGAPGGAPPEATSGLGGYLAGRHARRHRDTAAAQVYFTRALDDAPDNPALLGGALSGALAERDMTAAAAFAERLAAAAPDNALARVTLATVAMAADDAEAALAQIDSLPESGLNRYAAPLLRGWALAASGRGDDALAALRPLAARAPFVGSHDYHAALIAELSDRPELAETSFSGALRAPPRGGAARVVLAAGGFHRRQGRDDAARAVYDAFLDANPGATLLDGAWRGLESGESPPPLVRRARDGYAEALYDIARALFRENAVEPAWVHAQLCLAARDDHDACRMLLGDILAEVERHADAAAAYESAPPDSPLRWTLRLRAADMIARLDRVDAAAGRLREMAQERPERPDALIALADLMLREERYPEAVEAYDRALARIPTLENRHWPLLYARGMSLERSREWDRAERDFLRALELEPDQPLVLNYLGYSWVEMGRHYDRAREMIEKAVAQRPEDGYIVDSLGWVLYRLGDYEEAAVHLERAVALRPGDPVILDHFGDSLWRIGRRNEARFQWRRALVFEPEPDLEAALRDKLDNGLAEAADAPVETEDL